MSNAEEDKNKDIIEKKVKCPKSPKSKLKYKAFIKLFQYYKKRILKQMLPLCQNDMKVIHDLLTETIDYITLLYPLEEFNKEREQLYDIAIDIIEHLDSIIQSDNTPSYPIKMKVKLYESKFAFYFKQAKDFTKAEMVLNEIIKFQEVNNFSLFNQASALFFAALIRFQLNDINSAETIAKKSLDILENKLYLDANEMGSTKRSKEFEAKKIKKISNILDFLAEIYFLEKNMNSAISCIENAYYLNLGHYGIEHKNTVKYNEQLERFKQQKIFYQDNVEGDYYLDDFKNRKIAQGNVRVFSGKGENYFFKVPYTNSIEPFLISLYQDNINSKDKFTPSSFVTNLYMDKNDLFRYLIIPDQYRENYLLYTDENMNRILEHIIVDKYEYKYYIDDIKLKSIVFSSINAKAKE